MNLCNTPIMNVRPPISRGRAQAFLVREGSPTRDQVDAMDTARLSDFFQSALYRRMCASSRLEREVRFMIEIPAGELERTSALSWGA